LGLLEQAAVCATVCNAPTDARMDTDNDDDKAFIIIIIIIIIIIYHLHCAVKNSDALPTRR